MPYVKIRITPSLSIDDEDIEEQFVRSSGPGGQNVNKVATAVRLRFDPSGLPADVRRRLRSLAGTRASDRGLVRIEASRFRTQRRNREDARERLIALIRQAAEPPRPRRATRPTAASRERRLQTKQRRAETKRRRRTIDDG